MTDEHGDMPEADESTALPGRVRAELTRLRTERRLFDAEQERLKGLLTDAEEELRALKADRAERAELEQRLSELAQQAQHSEVERRTAAARAEALGADVTTLRRERDELRAELTTCRTERDDLRMRLLEREQQLSDARTTPREPAVPQRERIAAEERATHLAHELDATRRTISWRVTAPLRTIRARLTNE